MILKYTTAVIWWNNDIDFPSQYMFNDFKNSLQTYNGNVNFNSDGTITIYDSNFKISCIYISDEINGQTKETFYKQISINDNGNGIYEINYAVDYWLTYMTIFLTNADETNFNFERVSYGFFPYPILPTEDPMIKAIPYVKNYENIITPLPTGLTTYFNFDFSTLNNTDALGVSYTFCNFVTYYVFKQNGTLIALPVLSTNEINLPYSYETGNRPTTKVFRGIKFNFTIDYQNGIGSTPDYYYNFENVLKGLAGTLGDNFVGKFFLPNFIYFNPKFMRKFRFTTSFQYTNNDNNTYNSGNNPFTTISAERITFLGIILGSKIYEKGSQLLHPEAKIYLPTYNISCYSNYTPENSINAELLRYYKFHLMNNQIEGLYCYITSEENAYTGENVTPELYLYSFTFNNGGYCKIDTSNDYENGFLAKHNNIEERTLFFGYQLPSETNAYLSWYTANKSQMETAKITQGLGFALSSMFSVLGLIISGTGIGAPIGLSMVAGGAMGAFSGLSGIAKTNASIADTQRQLQTNYAQSNISDFNFLSLWFWYSNSSTWQSAQYNLIRVEKPDEIWHKQANKILNYYGYYKKGYTAFSSTGNVVIGMNTYYWQWSEDETLKSQIPYFLSNKNNNYVINSNIPPDVINWIYQKCINGIRLWNKNPNYETIDILQ